MVNKSRKLDETSDILAERFNHMAKKHHNIPKLINFLWNIFLVIGQIVCARVIFIYLKEKNRDLCISFSDESLSEVIWCITT